MRTGRAGRSARWQEGRVVAGGRAARAPAASVVELSFNWSRVEQDVGGRVPASPDRPWCLSLFVCGGREGMDGREERENGSAKRRMERETRGTITADRGTQVDGEGGKTRG